MAELLGGQGRVLLLRYQEGSESTRQREEGFLERLAQHPGVQVVSSDQYAGPTRDTAKRASENLLNRYGAEIEGIFTSNESATVGMLLALQDIEKAGTISFVGFDASETLLTALQDGDLQGLVVQNPMRMGYLGVLTMVNHLLGQSVEKRVDTGVTLITAETMVDPAMQELLYPPIDRYLNGQ
jgi:ribose transport system substrate-binding protein